MADQHSVSRTTCDSPEYHQVWSGAGYALKPCVYVYKILGNSLHLIPDTNILSLFFFPLLIWLELINFIFSKNWFFFSYCFLLFYFLTVYFCTGLLLHPSIHLGLNFFFYFSLFNVAILKPLNVPQFGFTYVQIGLYIIGKKWMYFPLLLYEDEQDLLYSGTSLDSMCSGDRIQFCL